MIVNNPDRTDKNLWTNNDIGSKIAVYQTGSEEDEGRKLFIGNCSMCHTHDSYKKAAYHKEIQNQNIRWEECKKD